MSASTCWAHVGDLHLDEQDAASPWDSRDLLKEIVGQLNRSAADGVDFVYLPGDNADHGTADQYRAMLSALAPLSLPWRIIPGDHDFEPDDLDASLAAVPDSHAWPHVQIVSPCDLRLVTRPADSVQVPRPGEVTVTARIIGAPADAEASVRVDGGEFTDLWRIGDTRSARVTIAKPGLHSIGAWPIAGIDGFQLGPNKNGRA